MKICIFTHTFPRFSGDTVAPFMGVLTDALAKLGHEVFVLTPFDEKIKAEEKGNYKLVTYKYIFPNRLHLLGYSKTLKGDRSMSVFGYILSPLLYFFGFLALFKLVRKEKIEVISSHWIIPNGFIASLVSKIIRVPFTVTIPGSDVYMGAKNFFFRWMVGVAAKNASYVVSDSSYYLQQLNNLGFYPDKTEIIRYGVDVDKFKLQTQKHVYPIILVVGRMVAKKGFVYLVKAMPEILKKIPEAKLIMVGDGEERSILEKMAKKLGVYENIDFAGMVSYTDLPSYYQKADIFVMPSIKDESGNIDASPVSMMEAMVSGTPVITTRFGGSGDLIIEGKTGYLVKEKNPGEIAQKVIKLLGTGIQRSAVRKVAVDNFSSEVIAGRYVDVFRSIL